MNLFILVNKQTDISMVIFILKGSGGKKETHKLPSAQQLFRIWYQNVPTSLISRSFSVFDSVL